MFALKDERQLLGKDFCELLKTCPWTHGQLLTWYLDNQGKKIELEYHTSDSKSRYLDLSVMQFDTVAEQLLLLILQDVTERVKIEKMKQEFFDMVSHDMRSPLSSISLASDLLLDDADKIPEENVDQIRRIGHNSRHLIRLINDLLDIEKVELGEIQLAYDHFSVLHVCKEAIEIVFPQAAKRSIKVIAPENDFEMYADQDRICRVIINMLSNAIKFSPKNAQVEVLTQQGKDYVEISVKDQGRGIPQNMLDTVFERFKQVEASDGSKKGGSGLGLAICKGFVEAHGGIIKVESKESEGSRFWFRIPQPSDTDTAGQGSDQK
jgi:signal transduction histidine kinase